MRYRVACVGKPDGGPFAEAVARYLVRLRGLGETELVPVRASRASELAKRRREEATALRAVAVGRWVALDERGRSFDTQGLARRIADLEQAGEGRMTLLIGGADGLDPDLREEAAEIWRLSDLTMAHELALTVLLEQLYRVESLRSGHPYHRAG